MHGLIVATGSDWSLAGSIMTFAIPVGLFAVVATTLYFLYTRPHTVPGHRDVVPATPQQSSAAQPSPPAQPPPSAGGAPGYGGTPGSGGMPGPGPGQGRHDGREGME